MEYENIQEFMVNLKEMAWTLSITETEALILSVSFAHANLDELKDALGYGEEE